MASVSITKWKVQANQITLSTGMTLASLGAGAGSAGTATTNVQADADRDGYPFAEIELLLATTTQAWKEGSAIDLYLLRGNNGTDYETYDSATPPKRNPDATFYPLPGVTTAQRLYAVSPRDNKSLLIDMPAGGFTPFLFNRAANGTAFGSGTNTLKAKMRSPEQAT